MKPRLIAFAAVVALAFPSCRTFSAETTPPEIQAVPASQSVALEVAIEAIERGNPQWVDSDTGFVFREAILTVLRADKEAWDELDRFYNPEEN